MADTTQGDHNMKIQSELDEYVALAEALTVIRDRASRAARRHGTSYGDAYATSFADVANGVDDVVSDMQPTIRRLQEREEHDDE